MRKVLFILPLVFMLGCSSFSDKKGVDDFDQYIIGEKEGYVLLNDGQKVFFSHAVITSTFKTVRVFSETAHHTFLWCNILEMHIYHGKLLVERKEVPKDVKNIGEKIIDSGIKIKGN